MYNNDKNNNNKKKKQKKSNKQKLYLIIRYFNTTHTLQNFAPLEVHLVVTSRDSKSTFQSKQEKRTGEQRLFFCNTGFNQYVFCYMGLTLCALCTKALSLLLSHVEIGPDFWKAHHCFVLKLD